MLFHGDQYRDASIFLFRDAYFDIRTIQAGENSRANKHVRYERNDIGSMAPSIMPAPPTQKGVVNAAEHFHVAYNWRGRRCRLLL